MHAGVCAARGGGASLGDMTLDGLLESEIERLKAEGLLRDPADAGERARLLGRVRRGGGSAGQNLSETALDGMPIDATSNDYLGLASEQVDVSRETSVQATGVGDTGSEAGAQADADGGCGRGGGWAGADVSGRASGGGELAPQRGRSARAGAGAARLVQGTWPEHEELERAVAAWVGADAALLFSSGFAANSGTIAALAGPADVVLSDQLNHASIVDGCRLARAKTVVVPHLDFAALEDCLARSASFRARWVATESYFSMDGDGPDLAELRKLCDRHQAFLVVDEAHGLGVFGPKGAGRCADAGVRPDVLVGTLGKAVGTEGAFVAGSPSLRTWLWNRARTFVFSTAPSPATCVLTLRHVHQAIGAEGARARLTQYSRELRDVLAGAGVPLVAGSFGPIVSVLAGSNEAALGLAERLRRERVLVQAIRPPTVPAGCARVRVTLSAAHSAAEVARIGAAIVRAWGR